MQVITPSFFAFWYKEIPREIVFYFRILAYKLLDYFSVPIVLRTFFAPWKRDETYLQNAPLNLRMQNWLMNQVSRLIGASLRGFLLITYLLTFLIELIFLALVMIFWLFFPLVLATLFALGIYYLINGLGYGL